MEIDRNLETVGPRNFGGVDTAFTAHGKIDPATGELKSYITEILNYSERMTRHAISTIPNGIYEAEDFLDNDGITDQPIANRVKVQIKGDRATIDFTGSDPQVQGSVNAVYAITASVVFYIFRTLVTVPIPSNAGGMRPLDKYVQHFADIRALQDYIVERARRNEVPVVDRPTVESAVSEVIGLVLDAAERVEPSS